MKCKKCIYWEMMKNKKHLPLFRNGKVMGLCPKLAELLNSEFEEVESPEDFCCSEYASEKSLEEKPIKKSYYLIVRPKEHPTDDKNTIYISKSFQSIAEAKKKAIKYTKSKTTKWSATSCGGRIIFSAKTDKYFLKIQLN